MSEVIHDLKLPAYCLEINCKDEQRLLAVSSLGHDQSNACWSTLAKRDCLECVLVSRTLAFFNSTADQKNLGVEMRMTCSLKKTVLDFLPLVRSEESLALPCQSNYK